MRRTLRTAIAHLMQDAYTVLPLSLYNIVGIHTLYLYMCSTSNNYNFRTIRKLKGLKEMKEKGK